jgi:uncharacterized repeat protein (TIGR03803 family)
MRFHERRSIGPKTKLMLKEKSMSVRVRPVLAAFCFMALLSAAAASTNYQRLQTFGSPTSSGTQPSGQLLEATDGYLYGTTFGGGTSANGVVFRLSNDGATYSVIFSLTNVASPTAGVIECPDGALYGVASAGGANNAGAIFKLNKDGSGFAVLHDFLTNGIDGKSPNGGLIRGFDGSLYGTTLSGGVSNAGTVFKMSTNGTGYTTLYSFTGVDLVDGASPGTALFQDSHGVLFGTTQVLSVNNFGTVFQLTTNGTGFAILHRFTGQAANDGSQPLGSLVQGRDGFLYGTTGFGGGGTNQGIVFKINTNGAAYGILWRFATNNPNGFRPSAGLAVANNGLLYGTATFSDSAHNNAGTAFRMDESGGNFMVLHNFTASPDGDRPVTRLVRGSDGAWYGVTQFGGNANLGTAFKIFPPVTIDSIAPAGASMLLSFSEAAVGQSYQVQATTNLTVSNAWTVIGSNTAAADGTFQFSDTNAFQFPQRYYRSAQP